MKRIKEKPQRKGRGKINKSKSSYLKKDKNNGISEIRRAKRGNTTYSNSSKQGASSSGLTIRLKQVARKLNHRSSKIIGRAFGNSKNSDNTL